MIHPSYKELMAKINEINAADNVPPVTSRYSIVLATSKRARQLNNGAEQLAYAKSGKPLSVAVEEFYEGKVKMMPSKIEDDENEAAKEDMIAKDECVSAAKDE